MSVLGRNNYIAQMRLDLQDFLALESYVAFDFRGIVSFFTNIDRAYVVRGFDVIAKSGLTVDINVANSLVFNPQDANGSFYLGLTTDPNIQIDLPADQTNIFIEAVFTNVSQVPTSRALWDALALSGQDASGQEYNSSVDSQNVIKLTITANTSGFSEGSIPLFRASTSASSVNSFTDCRPLFFRLGTGGAVPDPLNKFGWANERTEPVLNGPGVADEVDSPWRAKDSSGARNDKSFQSFKETLDAIFTRISELAGVSLWYVTSAAAGAGPVSGISLNQLFFDTLGHSIQPSKNAAFKWLTQNGGLRLVSQGTLSPNGTTNQYHNGLIKWKSNYHGLQWELGGSFANTLYRNFYYDADPLLDGLRFESGMPVDGGNIYLRLEREASIGSGSNVTWKPTATDGIPDPAKSVTGSPGDFTGIALGDYIRKESEGYSRYYKVVYMWDGSTLWDNSNPTHENRIADSFVYELGLEVDIIGASSEEPLKYFRSRYSNTDIYVDDTPNTYHHQDANFYWLGRRVGDKLILRDYGTMQEGEEATTLDVVFAQGKSSGGGSKKGLTVEHTKEAVYDVTNGYSLKTGAGDLITIRRLKRDNTLETPTPGSDNSGALLEYTIAAPVGTIPSGSNLWVRLSDTTGGALSSNPVTNIPDDLKNEDVYTNRWEVLDAASTPADTFDNIDVFLLARKVVLNGQEALIFFDGSILTAFGQMINTNLDISGEVRLNDYDDMAIPFIEETGTKLLDQDVTQFFYKKSTPQLGLFNFRFENNHLYQQTPEDVQFFSNLGSHTLTLGGANSTIMVPGDMVVQGDYIHEDVGNIISEDKLITLGVGTPLNGAGGGGIELADNTQTSTQADSTIGSADVDLVLTAHGYSTGDIVGVASYDDIGGITAGEIGGQYEVVASLSATGQAYVVDANTLRIRTRGTATATETQTTSTPKTYKTPYSMRLSGSDGDYAGTTSWSFRVKGATTNPTITPVNDYGIVPTAHSVNMQVNRIPFVNDDDAGPSGADSTMNFTGNLTWDNSTNTFKIIGTSRLAGNFIPDADDTYDLGENSTPLRWRMLHLGSSSDSGLTIGDSVLYEESANTLRTDDDFYTTESFRSDKYTQYKDYAVMTWPSPLPPSGYVGVFARNGLIFQQRADGDQKLLTNGELNVYEEIVDVVSSPSGNNEMAPISSPPVTVTLPKDLSYLIGVTLQAVTTNGSATVTVSAENHGLTTGDLITVFTTADIGGITANDLKVTNVPCIVTDLNTFTYVASAPATADDTGFLDKVTAERIRYYMVGAGELEVYLNGVLQEKGKHWDESGTVHTLSNQIIWLRELKVNNTGGENDTVTYRIDANGGQMVFYQVGGLSLQGAYSFGQTININAGVPVTIIESSPGLNEKVLNIIGSMTVTGVIDPMGITFSEESSDPLTASQNGLWVAAGIDKDLMYSRNGLASITITKDFIYRDGSLPMTGVLDMGGNQVKGLPATQADDDHGVSKKFMDDTLVSYVLRDGTRAMTGNFDLGNNKAVNCADPATDKDVVPFLFANNTYLRRDGANPMTGNINMDSHKLTNLDAPVDPNDSARLAEITAIQTQLPNYLLRDGTLAMTGNLNMDGNQIENLPDAQTANGHAISKKHLDDTLLGYLLLSGGTMTGNIVLDGNKVTGSADPSADTDLVPYLFANNTYLRLNGSNAMSANLNIGGNKAVGMTTPSDPTDGANKQYVDDVGAQLPNYLLRDGSLAMTGDLDMNGQQIVGLPNTQTLAGHAVSKAHLDTTLAGYLPLGGGTMSGVINMGSQRITALANATSDTDAVSRIFGDGRYLLLSGSNAMAGDLNFNNNKGINLATPTDPNDAARLAEITATQALLASYVKHDGTVAMTGDLNLDNNFILNVKEPTLTHHGVNKGYVDSLDRYVASYVKATNNTGSLIPAGTVVSISQSVAGEMIVADASDILLSEGTIGVTVVDVADGATSDVQISGLATILTAAPLGPGRMSYLDAFNPGKAFPTRPTTPGVVRYRLGVAYSATQVIIRPEFDGVNGNIYEEILEVVSGTPANDNEVQGPLSAGSLLTLPADSRDSDTTQAYTVGAGMIEVDLNDTRLIRGDDDAYDEVGTTGSNSTQIEINRDLRVGDKLVFRIDQLGTIFIEGSSTVIPLQSAYNAGNTIIVSSGRPIAITGPSGEKLLTVDGDIEVTGVIDPKAIQFTRIATNPFSAGQDGIYINTSGDLIQVRDGGTQEINITEQVTADIPKRVVFPMKNTTGSQINKFTPVSVNRANGRLALVDVSNENLSVDSFGVAYENIADGNGGGIIQIGRVENITGVNFGTVYVSKTGGLTNTIPEVGVDGFIAGDRSIEVGVVVENDATPGQKDLVVRVRNLGTIQ